MKINNILSICFVAALIFFASSCKKDSPKKVVTANDISGTAWVYTKPSVGIVSVTFRFTSSTVGTVATRSINGNADGNFTYTYSNWTGEITGPDGTISPLIVDKVTKSTIEIDGKTFVQQ